ncbi:hypothetical protein D3C84_678800 [compost metagenome]
MQVMHVLVELLLQSLIVGNQIRQLLGRAKATAVLNPLPDAVDNSALLTLMAMQLQTKIAQTCSCQSSLDHLKRCALLRNEQHFFALGQRRSNHVGDGLRLTGTGRPLDHKVIPANHVYQCAVLRTVSVIY